MVRAARNGRFAEYNIRCACIAQLVEQLTLNQRTLADASGRASADSNQLPRAKTRAPGKARVERLPNLRRKVRSYGS